MRTVSRAALDGTRYRTGTRTEFAPGHTEPAYPGARWQAPLWTRLRTLLETGEPQGRFLNNIRM